MIVNDEICWHPFLCSTALNTDVGSNGRPKLRGPATWTSGMRSGNSLGHWKGVFLSRKRYTLLSNDNGTVDSPF